MYDDFTSVPLVPWPLILHVTAVASLTGGVYPSGAPSPILEVLTILQDSKFLFWDCVFFILAIAKKDTNTWKHPHNLNQTLLSVNIEVTITKLKLVKHVNVNMGK